MVEVLSAKGLIARHLALAAMLALCVACVGRPPAEPPASAPLLRDRAAIEALMLGGLVVYVRHAHTDPGQDSDLARLDACDRQRNLSARGLEEARMIGMSIRRLRIPVASVAASPFCRTRATAQLVLGQAPPERRLADHPDLPEPERNATIEFVRARLASRGIAGGNVFLVGHSPPFDAATQSMQPPEYADKPFLKEGEMALIRADGRGGYALVGHIAVNAWRALE